MSKINKIIIAAVETAAIIAIALFCRGDLQYGEKSYKSDECACAYEYFYGNGM